MESSPTSAFRRRAKVFDEADAAACRINPEADPWSPDRVVWPLLDVVDEHLDDP